MIDLEPAVLRMIGLVTEVVDDQLELTTPCPHLSVGDLIDHVGVFADRFAAAARKQTDADTPPAPPPDRDNLGPGWRSQITHNLTELADAWRDPQAWEGTTYAGPFELPAHVAGAIAIDELVVHGWDLAVATGQRFAPADDEIETAMGFVTSFDAPRDGRLFGPVVSVRDGATALDRLLGATGRDPAWTPPNTT